MILKKSIFIFSIYQLIYCYRNDIYNYGYYCFCYCDLGMFVCIRIYTLIATNYVINSHFVISGLIVSTQLLLAISFVNAATSTRESITGRCKVTFNLCRSKRSADTLKFHCIIFVFSLRMGRSADFSSFNMPLQ